MLSPRNPYDIEILYKNQSAIKMSGYNIGHEKLMNIIEKLDIEKLTEIKVGTDELSSNMLNYLLIRLRPCRNLRILDLRSKYIKYNSIECFFNLLYNNKSIKYLNILNRYIDDNFIKYFVTFLKKNKTLSELSMLVAEMFLLRSMDSLYESLITNYTLTYLDIKTISFTYELPLKINLLLRRNRAHQRYCRIKKTNIKTNRKYIILVYTSNALKFDFIF